MDQDQDIKLLSKDEFYDCYQMFEKLAASLPPEIKSEDLDKQIDYLVKTTNHFRKYNLVKNRELLQNYRDTIKKNYKPLYPQIYNFKEWEFDESYLKYINGDPEKLDDFLVKEHENIFSFPIFKPSFCETILKEVDHFEDWCKQNGLKVNRPNSMNNYGAILDDFGMYDAIQDFINAHVNKLSKYLYPYIGATLNDHHAFVVSYEIGKDEDLDFHIDDSEVTLNICLGRDFVGGDLYFGGIRCAHHAQTEIFPDEKFILNHSIGRAVIHLGKHRHAAMKIKSGSRFNMIIWCKAKSKRTLYSIFECPEWCKIFQYL